MKKLLLVNLLPTGSLSLDMKVNPHDVDFIMLARALEMSGWEVWLQEPFTRVKQSSWPRKIARADSHRIKEFDAVLLTGLATGFWEFSKYMLYSELFYNQVRAIDFFNTLENLYNFTGRVFGAFFDPREQYVMAYTCEHKYAHHMKPEDLHRLKSIMSRVELITAVPLRTLLDTLDIKPHVKDELLSRPNYISTHPFHLHDLYSVRPLRESYDYECVYIGVKLQTKVRKDSVLSMVKGVDGVFTAGPIILRGVKNMTIEERGTRASHLITKQEVWDYQYRSRVSLLLGEPGHINWPTPRLYEAFTCGSIPAIHPAYRSASLIPRTASRCMVDHISKIPKERSWEEETYAIMLEELEDLKKTPLGVTEFKG